MIVEIFFLHLETKAGFYKAQSHPGMPYIVIFSWLHMNAFIWHVSCTSLVIGDFLKKKHILTQFASKGTNHLMTCYLQYNTIWE